MVQFQRRQKAPGGERRLLRHTYVCAQYVRSRRGETLSFQYLFIEGYCNFSLKTFNWMLFTERPVQTVQLVQTEIEIRQNF